MSTAVTSLPYRENWLTRIRRRELFVGMGYAITVTLILMVGWDLDGILTSILDDGFATTLVKRGTFFVMMMGHQLPTVPVLTVAINLAPASGPKRYACLGLVGVLMWGFAPRFLLGRSRQPEPRIRPHGGAHHDDLRLP